MRVIAGNARRLLLNTPKGTETRPTQDIIKETLFNILNPDLFDCSFLDLFAGSGGIGIEALSRGAKEACFVDNQRAAVECIKENLSHTKLLEQATVYGTECLSALRQMEYDKKLFDIVYMDPPYGKEMEVEAMRYLKNSILINEDTQIIVETSLEETPEKMEALGYELVRTKKYKANQHLFFRRA